MWFTLRQYVIPKNALNKNIDCNETNQISGACTFTAKNFGRKIFRAKLLSESFSVRNFFHGAQNLNLKHCIQSFVDSLVDKFRTSLKNVVR